MRNGNNGYDCMKFTPKEHRKAAELGLHLGDSYKSVQHTLTKHGWKLDRAWLNESATGPLTDGELICGSGWDAVCSTAFKSGKVVLVLTFSGTNSGIPLIAVDQEK